MSAAGTMERPMAKKADRPEKTAKGSEAAPAKGAPMSTKLYPANNNMLVRLAEEAGESVADYFDRLFGDQLTDLYADYLDRQRASVDARRHRRGD